MATPETNLILILLIAGLNAFTAWATMQSKKTIGELEKNTNSMKDQLVAITAKTSFREGSDAGLATAAAAAAGAATAATAVAAKTVGLAPARSDEPVKVDVVKMPPPAKS